MRVIRESKKSEVKTALLHTLQNTFDDFHFASAEKAAIAELFLLFDQGELGVAAKIETIFAAIVSDSRKKTYLDERPKPEHE